MPEFTVVHPERREYDCHRRYRNISVWASCPDERKHRCVRQSLLSGASIWDSSSVQVSVSHLWKKHSTDVVWRASGWAEPGHSAKIKVGCTCAQTYHLYRPTRVLPACCFPAQFPATTGRKHVSYLRLFPASRRLSTEAAKIIGRIHILLPGSILSGILLWILSLTLLAWQVTCMKSPCTDYSEHWFLTQVSYMVQEK